MPKTWNPTARAVIRDDGSATFVPYLKSTDQVERWVAAGFDLVGAADRMDAFADAWGKFQTAEQASRRLTAFLVEQVELAMAQGVPADDMHLGRIAASQGAFDWTPPEAVPAA